MVKLIIRKSDAFKIDLNTEDNFGKTGISYFKMQDQEELSAYGFKNNVVVLLPDFETDFQSSTIEKLNLQCQTE